MHSGTTFETVNVEEQVTSSPELVVSVAVFVIVVPSGIFGSTCTRNVACFVSPASRLAVLHVTVSLVWS